MLTSVNALAPIFLVILFGTFLSRFNFFTVDFWYQLEKLVYFVFFPLMLASRIALADFSGLEASKVLFAVTSLVLAMTGILLLLRPFISNNGPEFTSVYQGGIRFNTNVVLAAVSEIFGDYGIALAAIVMALLIPLLNLLCVIIFAFFAGQTSTSWQAMLLNIIKNPLIIGCLTGVFLNITGLGLPGLAHPLVEILSRAALPLGLLTVGAALSLASLRSAGKALIFSNLIKLLLMPLVAVGVGVLFGLSHLDQSILLIFAAMPTATSAYILARQLGGDASLMASIVTSQTLLAMLSLPAVLALHSWAFS